MRLNYQEVAQNIIDLLNKSDGNVPWRKKWKDGPQNVNHNTVGRPYNPTTGTLYSGINFLILQSTEFDIETDPRFMTFKQAKDRGYYVKDAKNFTKIYFMAKVPDSTELTLTNNKNASSESLEIEDYTFIYKEHRVYHASQIEGLELFVQPEEFKQPITEDFQEIQSLIDNAKIDLQIGGNRAFYRPSTDTITMPPSSSFDNLHSYYSVLLHEIGHWTMQEQRVPRNNELTSYDATKEKKYAAEELVAELFSLYAAPTFKVAPHFENTLSYLEHWITMLENDPKFIWRASSIAERAVQYCAEQAQLQRSKTIELEQLIDQSEISFPFYGKTEKELQPFINDLLKGKTTEMITGLSKEGGKPFDAHITLSKKPDGAIRVRFTFPYKPGKSKSQYTSKKSSNKPKRTRR